MRRFWQKKVSDAVTIEHLYELCITFDKVVNQLDTLMETNHQYFEHLNAFMLQATGKLIEVETRMKILESKN